MIDLELKEVAYTEQGAASEDGVFPSVLICGRRSKNGKDYSDAALRDLAKLIEQRPYVYCDHDDSERRADDRFGSLAEPKVAPDGLRGRLAYLTAHPMAARCREDVQRGLKCFGLSINARGKGKRQPNGRVLVEKVTSLKSVDVVTEAATTVSLVEQEGGDAPADPNAEMAAAQDQAVLAIIHDGSLDVEGKLAKIKALLEAHSDMNADSDQGGDVPAAEQVKAVTDAVLANLREQYELAPKGKPAPKYVKPKAPPAEVAVALVEQTVPQETAALGAWLRDCED